ncbi:MAG: cupredoxin domain-containing protein [Polyangiales bacterium]
MKHVAILALFLLPLAAACDSGGGEDESSASEAKSQAEAKRVEVKVDDRGYHPAEVEAEVGKPLTLVFTRTTDEGCGDELVIASKDIERKLPLNEPVEVSLTPDSAGEIGFACGMDMYKGAVVVQ